MPRCLYSNLRDSQRNIFASWSFIKGLILNFISNF